MEDLNQNYESIVFELTKIFIKDASINIINEAFKKLAKDTSLNDMTAGSLFGYMLIWWTEEYKNPGDQKSMSIIKQSLMTIQEFRPVIYPQIWRHLQSTHLSLVSELFPERF
jgi:hypothetical protein